MGTVRSTRPSPTFLPSTKSVTVPPLATPPPSYLNSMRTWWCPAGIGCVASTKVTSMPKKL